MFSSAIDAAIQAHALRDYPREACGLVTASGYVPCTNVAEARQQFKIAAADVAAAGPIAAVAHSHVDQAAAPSAADMRGQIAMGVPWGIVATDGRAATPVLWWGGAVPRPKLIGRPFRHGPSGSDGAGDCYAAIRDSYAAVWGLDLPEFARDDAWWAAGQRLYEDGFAAAGFRRLARGEAPEPGDVFLAAIRSPSGTPNHGGVLLPGGLVFHHLHGRLSRREPAAGWARKHVTHWLRHERRPDRPFVIAEGA